MSVLLPVLLALQALGTPFEHELDLNALSHSGKVYADFRMPGEAFAVPLRVPAHVQGVAYEWRPLGDEAPAVTGDLRELRAYAPAQPGVYVLHVTGGEIPVEIPRYRLVVLTPADQIQDGRLGGYLIGTHPPHPSEHPAYAPPRGYMEVGREERGLRLSEHFQVSEFLTHDQADVWPKYVLVDPRLLDKLELTLLELQAMGVRAEHMVVMSGFRTPQYNRQGLDSGRDLLSRHQWGDAADVWVDSDLDWYMDDLDGDGEIDTRDSDVMLQAVQQVERRYPDLEGGAGIYEDNGVHGPYIHIDVRGEPARWRGWKAAR